MEARPKSSAWRSWPIVVIALAGIAIVVAVGVLVWPTAPDTGKHAIQPPPAPERMETNPLPPPADDPWGPHSNIDPSRGRSAAPIDPFASGSDDDVLGGIVGGTTPGPHSFMDTALGHACRKLASCSHVDPSLCAGRDRLARQPAPAGCVVGQRCLDAIEHLSCTTLPGIGPYDLFGMIEDCRLAATTC
jgi:hypothetical protein